MKENTGKVDDVVRGLCLYKSVEDYVLPKARFLI